MTKFLLPALILLATCDDDPSEVRVVESISINAVTTDTLAANPGTTLPTAVVEIIDQLGRPVPGIAVQWTLRLAGCPVPCSSDGVTAPIVTTTDASGRAATVPTLGSSRGVYLLIPNPQTSLQVVKQDTFVVFAGEPINL